MAQSRSAPSSVYDWSTEAIDRSLAAGRDTDALKDYFGPKKFAEFSALAAQPPRRRAAARGAAAKTLILPGIMGSTLGTRRSLVDRVVWLNPLRLAGGDAVELAVGDDISHRHTALDAIPYFYYGLRTRLARDGFTVEYHYYDWRLDLEGLGEELAERIVAEERRINLVAHSMGGLVARLALRDPAARAKVDRVVLIGTPSRGSYNALQLFDGTHDLARKIERIDLRHDGRELSQLVFNTLPAVYQLLPFGQPDFYAAANWPASYPRPKQSLLDRAARVADLYPAPDPATHYVIATGSLPTTVGARLGPAGVTYDIADAGDGTVPLASALLPGVKTKLVTAEHMNLPNDAAVGAAVIAVLDAGPEAWADESPAAARRAAPRVRTVRGADLTGPVPFGGRDGTTATAADRRDLFDAVFATVPTAPAPAPAGGAAPARGRGPLDGLTIGSRPRRRLAITLARGDLTAVDVRVAVAGVFQNVQPCGAVGVVNDKLGGVVDDILNRRMFDAQAGQVFLLPSPGRAVAADMVLLAGLGSFDKLDDPMHRFVAANVVRTLIQCRVQEFATVAFGSTASVTLERALDNLLCGFLEGLAEADPRHRFQRIVLCNRNPETYEILKKQVIDRTFAGLFGDTEIVLEEIDLGEEPAPARGPGGRNPAAAPQTYLSVRGTPTADGLTLDFAVLTPNGKATVVNEATAVAADDLDNLLAETAKDAFDVVALGHDLADLVLPPGVRALLASPDLADKGLTVVNDAAASRIPWETLRLGKVVPALAGGVSRRYAAGGLNVAKWLERRKREKTLRLLLVVNPTGDLAGAEAEGKAVMAMLTATPDVVVDHLAGPAATVDELKRRFGSGRYDGVHYAGHAAYDAASPEKSGILAADGVLSGADLADLAAVPTLVFFNACESGRVRKAPAAVARERLGRAVSFAEAFLVNGVPQLIGTYWPVGDRSAEAFAVTFYGALVKGASVGAALLQARIAVRDTRSHDWADYIHYGDPAFSLKEPPGGSGPA